MDAIILDRENKKAHLSTIPIPSPRPLDLLVRVHSVALNPVDSLYVANPLGETGRVLGSDFSGTIEAFGSSVPQSDRSTLSVGDRVAGFLQGACSINDRPGAFAEYLVVPWDLVWKVPAGLSHAEASTISLCALTAAQALFYRLGLPAPFDFEADESSLSAASPHTTSTSTTDQSHSAATSREISVFIYGASTSVVLYAGQLVRHAFATQHDGRKLKLIGAASRKNHSALTSQPYAYDHLVDYRDADWAEQVRSFTHGGRGVDYAFDCISEGATVANTASTLTGASAKMAVVRSRAGRAWHVPADQLPVEPVYGAVWEGLGEEVHYQRMLLPKSPRARAFTVAFYAWLSSGGRGGGGAGEDGGSEQSVVPRLQANPTRLMPGGLPRLVGDGFALLGYGTMDDRDATRDEEWMRPVSMEKLVYTVAST